MLFFLSANGVKSVMNRATPNSEFGWLMSRQTLFIALPENCVQYYLDPPYPPLFPHFEQPKNTVPLPAADVLVF